MIILQIQIHTSSEYLIRYCYLLKMSYPGISWNLYRELRKPLNNLQTRFNIVQAEPRLSMAVEPFDIIAAHKEKIEKQNSCNSNHYQQRFGKVRTRRPVTAASQRYRSKCPAGEQNETNETGDSIIYELHPTQSGHSQSTVLGVTTFVWDTEKMRYIRCKVGSNRASSAPAHTGSSLHLQKLFRAAQESSPVDSWSEQRHSPSLHGRRKEGKCHNSPNGLIEHTGADDSEKYSLPQTGDSDRMERLEKPVPLSFAQATLVNKVIKVTDETENTTDLNMNETTPVVFNKAYSPKVYTPADAMRRPQGFKVHQQKCEMVGLCGRKTPITRLGIASDDSMDEAENQLTYDEVISLAPKVTSGFAKNRDNSIASPITTEESEDQFADEIVHINNEEIDPFPQCNDIESSDIFLEKPKPRPKSKKPPKFSFTTAKKPESLRVKTPTVPSVVRASIVRQCSMPSYSILTKPSSPSDAETGPEKTDSQKSIPERTAVTKGKLLTKPVYQSAGWKSGKQTIPSITPNGPAGSKVFVTIALPKDTLETNQTSKYQKILRARSARELSSRHTTTQHKVTESHKVVEEVEQKVQHTHLMQNIGKSVNLSQRRASSRSVTKSNSSDVTNTMRRASSHNTSSRHVDVSIPTAGEALSVLSSNSFTLTDEFSNRSCDLDDVKSETSEMLAPTPPTPVPELEDTPAMRERIHQNLLKTISDTNQFISNMDERRRNKTRQIIYSDDEEEVDTEELEGSTDYYLHVYPDLPQYVSDSTQGLTTPNGYHSFAPDIASNGNVNPAHAELEHKATL